MTAVSKLEHVSPLEYCLLVKTDDDFNKDYTLSFDNEETREDWMKALLAAKENKPVPDSANRAFVKKDDEDTMEDSMSYFNRMLTALGGTYREDSFQDVILRLASFFGRIAFTVGFCGYTLFLQSQGLMSPDELMSHCEQVRKMASRIRVEMQHSNLMTQDIEHLFNDLNSSIDYCLKNCQQYAFPGCLPCRMKLRSSQEPSSDSSASSLTPAASAASGASGASAASPGASVEGASRGVAQHGFSNRYVGEGLEWDAGNQGDAGVGRVLGGVRGGGQADAPAVRGEVHKEARSAEERRAVAEERGVHHGAGGRAASA